MAAMVATKTNVNEIRPQPRQEEFLASSADIVIYGGGAGGGKTWALLMEPVRHISNPDFGAVVFRRTIPEITNEGALWDEAAKIYPLLDGKPNENDKQYTFPQKSRVTFSHLQHEKDKENWKSAQIPLIEFDQLETFTATQFFYMLSRNRSTCGVRPYVRASANPEPGWLADFLAWWIDDDGWAIPERSGCIRWMVRKNDVTYWGDSYDELYQAHKIEALPDDSPEQPKPKSVTFILSTVYDNQRLLEIDPGYLANLQALDYIDRQRLLGDGKRGGNWKIKPAAGKLFNKAWFEKVPAAPAGLRKVRFWDLAATEKELSKKDPDYTASTLMGEKNGIFYILDVTAEQIDPARTDKNMQNLAAIDGVKVAVRWEREGGASGKRDTQHIASGLVGFDAMGVAPTSDKITRAKPLAAQAFAGNVKIVEGTWNEEFLNHMHGQPDLPHDDIMDSSSGAFNYLAGTPLDFGSTKDLGTVEDFVSKWS